MAGQDYFGIRIDTTKLEQDAQQAKKAFDGIAEEAVKAGETVDNALGNGAQVAAGKFNMLNVSIQQIARELPSLTISPQMFFLAISNNLPILTDALSNARKEYEAMAAAGQKAIPVWKQVTKSLFSLQTGLSLFPTLLILFGDKLFEVFDSFGGGAKKINIASESLKVFQDTMNKGAQNAQAEIVDLKLLYDAATSATKGIEERTKAVDELQNRYPDYFKNMSDEIIMAGQAKDAYDKLSSSILKSAQAKAASEKIKENYKQLIDLNTKLEEAQENLQGAKTIEKLQKAGNIRATAGSAFAPITAGSKELGDAADDVKKYENQITELNMEIQNLTSQNVKLAENININDLLFGGEGNKGKDTINNLKQYLNELLELQEDNEERQIELTKSGTDKQLALIELRYKRQIEAVKKLQEDLKKAQGGKLTTEQQGIFGTAISGLQGMKQTETTSVKSKQIETEKKAMLEYLAEYGDYWEKRKAIADKYQAEISKATTEGEKLSLQAEMTEALAKLDDEAQKKTSIITKLFGDMATKSVAEMRKIADEAEQLLAFIEGGQYTKDNAFGITEEQFKVLSQSPEKLESIKNEISNVRNEADKAEPTFERIKNLLNDIFKTGGNKKTNLNELLNELNGQLNKVMQSVSFLSDTLSNLGDAFGSDALSSVGEGLGVAMNAVSSAMQGAQAGSLFGPIGAAAGAAVGVVTSLATSIAKIHDKKNEKEIEKLQEQIDALSYSYEDLGRAVEKAYSKDAKELIEDQNKLLEQQKVLIQQQIAEEYDKKNTDYGRIKEWQQQIEDINRVIEENKEKAVDAIFGEDVQSAIERLSSGLTDAWAKGTNATESARDAVRTMMQQMVTESIKAAIKASGSMEDIRKKLQEFYADNVLTGWEQDYIYNMAEELQKDLDAQFGWAEGLFKDKTSTTQQASAGGFTTMSQDSADKLDGTFTALYEVGLRVESQINIGNVNLEAAKNAAEQMRDITQNCYLELVEIRENTGAVVKPIQQMQKDILEMKNTIKERL